MMFTAKAELCSVCLCSVMMQQEVQAWMDFYDSDRDGKVTKDEYFALPKSNQRYWDSVDLNSDE